MKKLILLLFFLGLIPLGCICTESDRAYMEIQDFELIVFIDGKNKQGTNVIAASQNFKLEIHVLEYDYIVSNSQSFSPFTSSAAATSCLNMGYNGLKPKIDSIKIYSDNYFNGIAPGENLDSVFHAQYYDVVDGEKTQFTGEFDLLKDYLNISIWNINQGFLQLNTKPQDNIVHQFTVQLFFENKTLERTKTIHFRK